MTDKKRSFFERLTGSMRVNEDATHDPDFDQDYEEDNMPSQTKSQKTIRIKTESDPFSHTYDEYEEEDGELPIDVHQNDSEIIVQAFIAGVKPDEIQIAITRDSITVKGKRQASQNIEDNDYYIRELYWGTFSRTIELPAEVEPEEAEAVEKHGLIIIKIPKIDKQKKANIRVKSI